MLFSCRKRNIAFHCDAAWMNSSLKRCGAFWENSGWGNSIPSITRLKKDAVVYLDQTAQHVRLSRRSSCQTRQSCSAIKSGHVLIRRPIKAWLRKEQQQTCRRRFLNSKKIRSFIRVLWGHIADLRLQDTTFILRKFVGHQKIWSKFMQSEGRYTPDEVFFVRLIRMSMYIFKPLFLLWVLSRT